MIACICLMHGSMTAQISTYKDQLIFELEQRGIDQEEFYALLEEQGYDPEDLDNLSVSEAEDIGRLLQDYYRQRFIEQDARYLQDTADVDTLDSLGLDSLMLGVDSLDLGLDSVPELIYGHSFFRSGQISLIPLSQGYNPPESYILGAGDEIVVSIFGSSAEEERLVVQDDGSVRIYEGQVRVTVGGASRQEARVRLERAYKEYYRFSPNQFSLTVTAIRPIRVQVFGQVLKQGDMTISAANSITQVIAAAGGMTDDGSVRNIKLIKRTGEEEIFDFYELLTSPSYLKDFSLSNGDYIFVPAAQRLASIEGPVIRPHMYELKEGDGLFDLIEFAGGLKGKALLRSMKINRYENDKRVVKDVPYAERVKQKADFPLENGDQVIVTEILDELENYVTITGDVRSEGNFQLVKGLTLKDVLLLAGVRSSTKMDKAYLKRLNESGRISIIPVSLEDALNGVGPSSLIMMQDRDELEVWSKERFLDNKYIKVAGAVRFPEQFDYDSGGTIRVSDLIDLAGGLRTDAAPYAIVHRLDPLNPNQHDYVRLDLERLVNDANAVDNIFMEPYDSLHIYSLNEFQEDVFITISGAVNEPGEFVYGEGMTMKDAVLLANGFKSSSATNRIEVARVVVKNNEPTETVIHQVAIDRNQLQRADGDDFILEPFDQIFVRYVPRFELQQNVHVYGEVTSPGDYSLMKDNESIFDIVQRAGGVTKEAYPAAATFYRAQDSLGFLIMRLDEILDDPSSLYNHVLLEGDSLFIPKVNNFVKISGATTFIQQSDETEVNAPYIEGKNALYYINNYAGGFADNARRDKIIVRYPNGEVKQVKKTFLFGRKYPDVQPGSTINVWTVAKDNRSDRDKEDVNWTKVLGDSIAQATSILGLLLLVQRLD